MKTMVIPKDMLPFKVTINGVTYVYEAGTEQEVPDEVAEIIMNRKNDYPPKDREQEAPFNAGDVEDVQVNGVSVVEGGVANVPVATAGGVIGVVGVRADRGITMGGNNAVIAPATEAEVTNRVNYKPIVPASLDFAVKSAMTDGVGAAWTDAEKAAARERLGISGGDGGNYYIYFTKNGDTATCDKTFDEIEAAYDDGKNIVAINDPSNMGFAERFGYIIAHVKNAVFTFLMQSSTVNVFWKWEISQNSVAFAEIKFALES